MAGLIDMLQGLIGGGQGAQQQQTGGVMSPPGTPAMNIFGGGQQGGGIREFLQDAAPMIAMMDPLGRNNAMAAAMMQRTDKRRADKKATQQANQTVEWLKRQGMSAEEAQMIGSDPVALRQWYMQRNDPMYDLERQYKQAQIDKMQRDAAGGDTRFGLNPIYGQDAEGNTVLGVLGTDGTFKPVDTGDVNVSTGVDRVDLGTHYGLLDKRSGQMVGTLPKENYQEAFDKGAGSEAGKAQGEAMVNLPTDLATAEQAITELDELIAHPGLSSIAGPFDQYRPSWSMGAEGRDALARFNQAKGRAFLQAFGMLKGGGQITEIEGIKAEQAMARMDRAQGEAEFKKALEDFRDAVKTGMEKMRQRAGQTGSSVNIGGYTIEQVD